MSKKKKSNPKREPSFDIEQLSLEALDAIQDGDYAAAMRIGKKIERVDPLAGIPLMAMAHMSSGNPEKAITDIHRGLKLAPDHTFLLLLMGRAHIAAGQFEEAARVQERAFSIGDFSPVEILEERLPLLNAQGKYEEVLALLDSEPPDDEAVLVAGIERVRALTALNRHAEAVEAADACFALCTEDDHPQSVSLLRTLAADARQEGGMDSEGVRDCLRDAIRIWRGNSSALETMRALDDAVSDRAWIYRIACEGSEDALFEDSVLADCVELDEEDEDSEDDIDSETAAAAVEALEKALSENTLDLEDTPLPFHAGYFVVADNDAEARAFVRGIEPRAVAKTLEFTECTRIEKAGKGIRKGVFIATPYGVMPYLE